MGRNGSCFWENIFQHAKLLSIYHFLLYRACQIGQKPEAQKRPPTLFNVCGLTFTTMEKDYEQVLATENSLYIASNCHYYIFKTRCLNQTKGCSLEFDKNTWAKFRFNPHYPI